MHAPTKKNKQTCVVKTQQVKIPVYAERDTANQDTARKTESVICGKTKQVKIPVYAGRQSK